MIKLVIKKILNYIIKNKQYYILAIIYRFLILERLSNGVDKIIHSKPNSRITVLAFDSDRYRGDLEVLASDPLLRVLSIRSKWQGALIGLLYNKDEINSSDYSRASIGDTLYDVVKRPTQSFMCKFLKVLFSIVKVDCVINVSYRYIEDIDWTLASEKVGIPHIMLYRECLLQKGTRIYSGVVHRHQSFNFRGSHIIVHNETCKDSFIESSFIDKEKISVVGALRMDKYLSRLRHGQNNRNHKRKRFVLFYFPYDMSLFGKSGTPPDDYKFKYAFSIWPERKKYFRDIHSSIVELAIENPDIDFVIKPKRIMMTGPSWEYYKQILSDIDFDNKVNNYFIEPNADVHNLILNSDVICSLQSSTAIEAAISGKPVILPVFDNYKSTENYQDFSWKKYLELFDIASDKQNFKDLILKLMNCNSVNDDVLNKRKKVFHNFFNDLEGVSLNGYVDVIKNVVKDSKCQ